MEEGGGGVELTREMVRGAIFEIPTMTDCISSL
jgi:hypothetical protein